MDLLKRSFSFESLDNDRQNEEIDIKELSFNSLDDVQLSKSIERERKPNLFSKQYKIDTTHNNNSNQSKYFDFAQMNDSDTQEDIKPFEKLRKVYFRERKTIQMESLNEELELVKKEHPEWFQNFSIDSFKYAKETQDRTKQPIQGLIREKVENTPTAQDEQYNKMKDEKMNLTGCLGLFIFLQRQFNDLFWSNIDENDQAIDNWQNNNNRFQNQVKNQKVEAFSQEESKKFIFL